MTKPAAPTLSAVTPKSPSNVNTPTLTGNAEAGSTVNIFSDAACTTMIASGTAESLSSPGIQVNVTDNSTNAFTATATDAAGNVSPCSTPLAYVEDSAAPAAPVLSTTVPASPSRTVIPSVHGTAEASAVVTLYPSADCTGTMIGMGSADASGAFAITATVPPGVVTAISARATDAAGNVDTVAGCSNSINYEQNASAVSVPTLVSTTPTSPSATVTTPTISGTAELGVTVRLYTNPACSGTPAATGTADSSGNYSIGVTVSPNTTTIYYAQAFDSSVNQASVCSTTGITYTHDSTAPSPPVVLASTPPSPSNSGTPTISGTSEAGSLVQLYTDSSCSTTVGTPGTALANGTWTSAATASASTTFYATAKDTAGNVSACSSSFLNYVYDATPPAAPSITATVPTSPSTTSNTPLLTGTAEANSVVRIYRTADCTGTEAGNGAASGSGTFGIGITVPSNSTTSLTATATDAAGNVSQCSSVVTYTHDDLVPAAPVITSTTPTSPSNMTTPTVNGTAEAGATVTLYTNSGCTTQIGTSQVATSGTFAIAITVTANASTTLYTKAKDSAGNFSACSASSFTYTEDQVAPAAPTLNSVPPSRTNTMPAISGTAEAGATISVYTTNNCTGTVAATTTAAGGSYSVAVTVTANTATPFTTKATDAAGNVSACSTSFTYIHDNVAPAMPTSLISTPTSPAGSNNPTISGGAEASSTVHLFTNSSCTSAIAGTATATAGATFSLPMSVSGGSTNTWYATATDAAGNESACSTSSVTYVQDSVAPASPSNLGSTPTSPSSNQMPMITGTAEAGSTVKLFTNSSCTGSAVASGTANGGNAFSITVTATANGSTTYWATATDTALNISACTASGYTFVHDNVVPANPTGIASNPVSPANNNTPQITGNAEASSTVTLWSAAGCSTGQIGTGTATVGGTFAITTSSLTGDATTTIYVKATDAAGNSSGCVGPLNYVEDSTNPTTPFNLNTSPNLAANNNNTPSVTGTSELGATINIYTVGTCTGSIAGSAVAGAGGAFSVPVNVSDNTTVTYWAKAVDGAGNTSGCSASGVTYVEDSDPPSTPAITGTTPTPPANNNNPQVDGTGDTGSTVKIWTTNTCTGSSVGTGTVVGGVFHITLGTALTGDLATTLYANSSDAATNTSGCSPGFVYTEDSTAPGLPTGLATNPVSPANNNNPQITGTAEANSTVRAYSDATCTTLKGTATANGSGSFAISVAVLDTTTTTFYLRASDAATNTSACSAAASITYVEDSTQVETPTLTGTTPASPSNGTLTPAITGNSQNGYTIKIYTTSNCTGTVVGTAVVSGTTFSIPLSVAQTANTTVTYYANAFNNPNTSGCSNGVTYVHDNVSPPAPTGLASTPTSPSNDQTPTITGSAEAGSTVTLYNGAGCTGTLLGTGAATGGTFSIQTSTLTLNATTTIYAKATDAAGNGANCTAAAFNYVEDSTAPAAPTVTASNPTSPNNSSTSPTISGGAESGATVKIYTTAGCTGSAIATTTAIAGNTYSVVVNVSANQTTTLKATATDPAGNTSACTVTGFNYTHDNQAPATPNLIITPAGPANNNSPVASGTAEAGSTVSIYPNATCTAGTAVATGTAAAYASPGLTITGVLNNTTYNYSVKTVDAAGNGSGCSASVQYIEDSNAPTPPTFSQSTPASPNNTSLTPVINGAAEAGSTVKLFTNSACTGSPAYTGTAAAGGTFAISVTVTANTSVTFYATATDVALNASACSSGASGSFTYTHDNSNPAVPSPTGTTPASPSNNSNPTLNGTAEAGATVLVYTAAACSSAVASGTATGGNFSIVVTVPANQVTNMYVKAQDPAGNTSACTTVPIVYRHDSNPPGIPNLTSLNPTSPSSSNTTVVSGTTTLDAYESNATIKLWGNSACTTPAGGLGTGTSTGTSFGVTATVASNSNNTIYATASDGAGNTSACSTTSLSYIEDSSPPNAPSITGSTPASPANNNTPTITGTAEAGANVKLYTVAGCGSGLVGSGPATGGSFSIVTSTLPGDTTTNLYATATDASLNTSACSAVAFQYREDSTANAPVLGTTTPASPNGSSTNPTINGSGEANATIKIFATSDCTGAVAASSTISAAGTFSIAVNVSANTSTNFSAYIIDQATNQSVCSNSINYTHDTTAPTGGAIANAVAISNTQLYVTWSSWTDNLYPSSLTYRVCWTSTVGGACIGTAVTGIGATNYTIGGLTASSRYFVYVQAIDPVGNTTTYSGPKSDRVWGVGTNIAVSAGDAHTCSLLSDGTVRCWGRNNNGQLGDGTYNDSPTPVNPGLDDVVAIEAAGEENGTYSFTCALKADGTVWCWGGDSLGELGNDATLAGKNTPQQVSGISNAIGIASGKVHSCALLGTGQIKCWGFGSLGQMGNGTSNSSNPVPVTVSTINTAIQVDVGMYHSCALLANGSVNCWGSASQGQVGTGATTGTFNTPQTVSLAAGEYARQIAAGYWHTCALLVNNGTIKCWGGNASGQLGTNNTTTAYSPVFLTTDGTSQQVYAINITAGGDYDSGTYNGVTCLVYYTGFVRCVGKGASGELGAGGTLPVGNALVPVNVTGSTGVKQVSAGTHHVCSLGVDGTIKCWGEGANYRLGNGGTTATSTQVSVTNLYGPERAIQIKGSQGGYVSLGNFTCALMSNGLVRCWGQNTLGQLGTNDTTQRFTPGDPVVNISGVPQLFKDLSVGGDTACAVTAASNAMCWGRNIEGQLADGTNTNKPYAINSTTGHYAVAGGDLHMCALNVQGYLYCWGDDTWGAVGDATAGGYRTSINMVQSGVRKVEAHGFGSCVILGDGTAKCWGYDAFGELGDGNTSHTQQEQAVVVSGSANLKGLAGGRYGMCGVTGTGAVKCAGWGDEGEMGNNTFTYYNETPVINWFANFQDIAGGGNYHFCGIMVGGNLRCWGKNDTGQLGIGGIVHQSIPQLVGLTYVKAIGLGRQHSCALLGDGTAQCWGLGDYGQLGDDNNSVHNANTPVPVVYFP